MKLKSIIRALLLAFVVVSLVTLVLKELNTDPDLTTDERAENVSETTEKVADEKIVVYYFHGNRRCNTCKAVEANTTKAVQSWARDDLKDITIELSIVNVDDPVNEHFVESFELTFRSIVIARFKDGKQQDWKKLEDAWKLADDELAFIDYIHEVIASMLKEKR